MNTRVVRLFTGKCYKTIVAEGGFGHWRASEKSILSCSYVLAVRNRHSKWAENSEEHGASHGTAFMIARIVGLKPSPVPRFSGRFVIVFDRFARLSRPNSWPARMQNPISYTDLDSLKLDLTDLTWQEFPSGELVSRSIAAGARA
jgi:hypothetical protein